MVTDVETKVGDRYIWQMAWSNLLNLGVIINPPLPAVALMDYWRGGLNKKGMLIGVSPHTKGKSFDLSGTDSLAIVQSLKLKEKIKGYLLERENNCIHVDIF